MSGSNVVSLRDVYGTLLADFGRRDDRIVVLDADLASSTRTSSFRKEFPNRYLNVGIAEQNMVGVAAGICLAGGIPFVNTFASFLTRRAADQIAISVAYPKLNVKFFGFHSGINLGEDGATQQAVEDLGIMCSIPGIRVYAPLDGEDMKKTLEEILKVAGPTYVRLARFPSPTVTTGLGKEDVQDGFYRLRDGEDLTVISTGTLTAEVLDAANQLQEEGTHVRVVGVSRIKPLSKELVDELTARRETTFVVVEEHNIFGGLSGTISQLLDEAAYAHVLRRVGVPDRFGESGPPRLLLEKFGLAGAPLINRLRAALAEVSSGR